MCFYKIENFPNERSFSNSHHWINFHSNADWQYALFFYCVCMLLLLALVRKQSHAMKVYIYTYSVFIIKDNKSNKQQCSAADIGYSGLLLFAQDR